VTAFFLEEFEFTPPQKRRLVSAKLSEPVIVELQSALEIEKGFETTRPADRRKMIRDLKGTIAAFQALAETIDRTNPWTVANLQPLAFAHGADTPLRDVKDMLGAYLGQRFHDLNHIRLPRQACMTKCG